MTQPGLLVKKGIAQNCLNWFQVEFRQSIVSLIESQFPNYPLPREVQSVLNAWARIGQLVNAAPDPIAMADFFENQLAAESENAPLFKQMILRYRRYRAAWAESDREKTFHPEMILTIDEEINSLDALVEVDWFQKIESLRLPRSNDFLPIQYIEQSAINQIQLAPRQYDEKFHILQSPSLFLGDLAYFRAKCADRETPLAVAFLDIDHFKQFNTDHGETKVDRNLLPRFMQTVEAHVYHHGYAYKQGGDEYLVIMPSLSRALAIAFLDELRCKVAGLGYPEIQNRTTVSIGVCIVKPDCPLTDREVRDRAGQAEQFAKKNGGNCIATYAGSRLIAQELQVVSPKTS